MSVTIKRPEELELMRGAGKILAKVHEQLGNELRPGMSTYENRGRNDPKLWL